MSQQAQEFVDGRALVNGRNAHVSVGDGLLNIAVTRGFEDDVRRDVSVAIQSRDYGTFLNSIKSDLDFDLDQYPKIHTKLLDPASPITVALATFMCVVDGAEAKLESDFSAALDDFEIGQALWPPEFSHVGSGRIYTFLERLQECLSRDGGMFEAFGSGGIIQGNLSIFEPFFTLWYFGTVENRSHEDVFVAAQKLGVVIERAVFREDYRRSQKKN